MNTLKNSFRVSSLALAMMACGDEATAEDPASALRALSGTYADPAPYAYGPQAFGHRTFTFDEGRWTLRFTLGLDPKLERPVFSFRTHGTYRVLEASAEVPGAFEALFTEDAKFVTLETSEAELAEAFGLAGCGLVPGREKDVSVSGCAGWKPVAVCNEDHDLLALTPEGGVRFGVRPPDNDMCTADKRPTALTPPVTPSKE